MSIARFEYHTEYVEIPFKTRTTRTLMIKSEEPTLEPDIPALLSSPVLTDRLGELGQHGWELVSVQSVSRGERQVGNQNAQGWAYAFSMPVGLLMFLKRSAN